MASGGIRYDFSEDDGFTQHENRTIRLPILSDATTFVNSISGWEWNFYIFDALKDNRDALATGALISKLNADITPGSATFEDLGTGPCIDIPIAPADTAGMKAKDYYYEAYRVDTDNQTRVAYGIWPLID